MAAFKVLIFVESRYKVNRKRIRTAVTSLLKEKGMEDPLEVSVAIVGDRKMRLLNKQYRNLDKTTNVLSFPQTEGEKNTLPPGVMHLGDIIISYPQVIRESAAEEMLIDDKIDELVKHSMFHLLGIHHQ